MELLYFPSNDLLIKVDYNDEANSLRYWTNRKMKFNERKNVEQFLLTDYAAKVDFYKKTPSLFIFAGIEKDLEKELGLVHLDNMLKYLTKKEKTAENKVKEAINVSMKNYYFEQIGDEILVLRGEIESDCCPQRIRDVKVRMSELLRAYNLYTNQQLTLQDIVPIDLRDYI